MSEADASNRSFDVWRSMVAAGASMGRVVGNAFHRHGLTGAQFGVLRVVGEAGEGGIKLSEVGEKLFVTCGNITGLVDRLEESGLVVRVSHPDDRRAVLAKLTPAGKALFNEIVPRHRRRIAALLSCLSPGEQDQLIGLLQRVKDSADRYEEPEEQPEQPGE